MNLTFLGGVGTVTGSKYLLDLEGGPILVDCGLFQGFKQLRLRNWAPFPVNPASLRAVVLTHAHLDHSGYLPLLVRNGFRGPVYCTEATRDLCAILLPDSGHLQERDAESANRHGYTKHHPAQPLYTQREAEAALDYFKPVDVGVSTRIGSGATFRLSLAGHILGAASVEIASEGQVTVFSGDLGRTGDPTMPDPSIIRRADHLVVESTYGNRKHDPSDPQDALAEIIVRTAGRGGTVVVPAFAVGRAHTLLYHLQRLKRARRIPDIPIYLDSPMAVDATDVYCAHLGEHRLGAAECRATCDVATYVHDAQASKVLDVSPLPKIIISASGMATGGRVLHHLKRYAPEHRNTILLTGFQAGGTRGAALASGAQSLKIHGAYVPVHAEVDNLHMLSAHADADEILAWLGHFESAPRMTFVTHGEPDAADALRRRIEEELAWPCMVPEMGARIALVAELR